MTVFRHKARNDKPWCYDFWLGGQRYFGDCIDSEGTPVRTKQQALDTQATKRDAAKQEQALTKSGLRGDAYTLNQAAVLYLDRKKTDAPSDYDNQVVYIREMRTFRDAKGQDYAGGHKAFVDITAEDNQAYRRHLMAKTIWKWTGGPNRKPNGPAAERFWKDTGRKLSPRQVNKYLSALKALFTIATRTRDPVTRQPVLDFEPDIKLLPVPRRIPRPIGDDELEARQNTMAPWARQAAELSRLFGLRHGEAFWVGRPHIDRSSNEQLGLRFGPGETKSGNEEFAWGGEAGSQLLEELEAQAIERATQLLITWPGKKHFRAHMAGKDVPQDCWTGLKSVRTSWRKSAKRAAISQPHRFHDVRARYITEVAKVQPAAAQDAARHQDPSTTALYIKLASTEIREAVTQAIGRRVSFVRLKAM